MEEQGLPWAARVCPWRRAQLVLCQPLPWPHLQGQGVGEVSQGWGVPWGCRRIHSHHDTCCVPITRARCTRLKLMECLLF